MSETAVLHVLGALNAVLGVLAPSDPIYQVKVEQRTQNKIEIGVIWQGGGRFSLSLFDCERSQPEIIQRLFDEIQDVLADSLIARGEARPCCNGHAHPRRLVNTDGQLWWECPAEGLRTPAFRC